MQKRIVRVISSSVFILLEELSINSFFEYKGELYFKMTAPNFGLGIVQAAKLSEPGMRGMVTFAPDTKVSRIEDVSIEYKR